MNTRKTTLLTVITLILSAAFFSASVHADCVDGPGLTPVEILAKASRQQITLLETVTSQQTVEKVIPALEACKKQKYKAKIDMVDDARIWARSVAAGDRSKEQQLLEHIKSYTDSLIEIRAQFLHIMEEIPGLDVSKLLESIETEIKAKQISNPEKLLIGRWYLLNDHPAVDYRVVTSELQFFDTGFAVINPRLFGEESYNGYESNRGGQEVVEWQVVEATERVPYKMSMGMTSRELNDYLYFRITASYMADIPEHLRNRKNSGIHYIKKTGSLSFLLNTKKGEILLENAFERKSNATRTFEQFLTRDAVPSESRKTLKNWPNFRQEYLNLYKKKVTELCDEGKYPSADEPYCKKVRSIVDSISIETKKRVLTAGQKKLREVASQYLLQPVRDYSDVATLPTSLPYEPMPLYTCKAENAAWHEQRRASGYSDTLWSIQVEPNKPEAGPDDDKSEFARYSTAAIVLWKNGTATSGGKDLGSPSISHIIHLRKDGVFGLSWSPSYKMTEEFEVPGYDDAGKAKTYRVVEFDAGKEEARMYYDPDNRWIYDGKRVNLFWQNGKQPYPLGVGAMYGNGPRGRYGLITAKYENARVSLISDHSSLFRSVSGFVSEKVHTLRKSPAYVRLSKASSTEYKALEDSIATGRCIISPNNATPENASNTQPKLQSKNPPIPKQSQAPAQKPVPVITKAQKAKPVTAKKKPASTLAGCWKWSNGAYIVIDPDGTARNGPFAATWKTNDTAAGRYTINWPSFVDTLSMSADGSTLSGANNFAIPVSATRKSGKAPGVEGDWLWSNGITVNFRSDSSVSGGPFRGNWSKAGDKLIIEWPLIDTVSLAADGRNLSTKNQFGPATAVRDAGCKGK